MTVVETPLSFDFEPARAERGIQMAADADFDRFFISQYDGLVRSLTAMTGNRELADDCVQEAFVRAYARWRRIRRYDNPGTWVRRVAINLSRDANRSDQRRRRREDHVHSQPVQAPQSPSDVVSSGLDVADLLSDLSRQQRAVAALFYVEDLSVAEIATSLELTAGAVKFHLNRARANLKAKLEASEARHG